MFSVTTTIFVRLPSASLGDLGDTFVRYRSDALLWLFLSLRTVRGTKRKKYNKSPMLRTTKQPTFLS